MLGSSCDDCQVPIMKNRNQDEICVVCERNYRKDLPPPKQEPKRVEQPQPVAPPKPVEVIKTASDPKLNDVQEKTRAVVNAKILQLLDRLEKESELGQI